MTALIIERKTEKLGQDVLPSFPTNLGVGMAANAKCFAGGITCLATLGVNAGYAVPGSTALGLVCLGIAEKTVDNTVLPATAGAIVIVPRQGVFLMNNSTGIDAIAAVNVGQDCYIVDDNTVAIGTGGGTRSRAGVVVAVDGGTPPFSQPTGVWVLLGITGSSSAYGGGAEQALLDIVHEADVATLAALAAYTKTAGVLTATGNGIMPAIDGVTPVVGTRFLLTLGAAAVDNGLWVVTSVGTAGLPWTAARPTDWASGSQAAAATEISVNQGTIYGNTQWFTTLVGPLTIDTTAASWYPETVTQQVTLVAGTVPVTNVPIVSATKVNMTFVRTTSTGTASTVSYQPVGAITPGAAGTANITFDAVLAAGTINAGDTSVGNLTVINR